VLPVPNAAEPLPLVPAVEELVAVDGVDELGAVLPELVVPDVVEPEVEAALVLVLPLVEVDCVAVLTWLVVFRLAVAVVPEDEGVLVVPEDEGVLLAGCTPTALSAPPA
jgi:hypothetical protein